MRSMKTVSDANPMTMRMANTIFAGTPLCSHTSIRLKPISRLLSTDLDLEVHNHRLDRVDGLPLKLGRLPLPLVLDGLDRSGGELAFAVDDLAGVGLPVREHH